MTTASRSGFSIAELVIAMFLSSIVLIALARILTPLVQAQAHTSRVQTVQLNLAWLNRVIDGELRQASLVSMPAVPGLPSGVLEGCRNASGTPPAPVSPDEPMRWFAFCESGGIAHYHSGSGCPGLYTCGSAPTASFVWGIAPRSSLQFMRESARNTLVTIDMKASSGEYGAAVSNAVAFSAPSGAP